MCCSTQDVLTAWGAVVEYTTLCALFAPATNSAHFVCRHHSVDTVAPCPLVIPSLDPKGQTLPRADIYAKIVIEQKLQTKPSHLSAMPQSDTPAFLVLLMQAAEESKQGFEAICEQIRDKVCMKVQSDPPIVHAYFTSNKGLDRVTKKACVNYSRQYSKVLDIVRMTFVCVNPTGVLEVLNCLATQEGVRIARI